MHFRKYLYVTAAWVLPTTMLVYFSPSLFVIDLLFIVLILSYVIAGAMIGTGISKLKAHWPTRTPFRRGLVRIILGSILIVLSTLFCVWLRSVLAICQPVLGTE